MDGAFGVTVTVHTSCGGVFSLKGPRRREIEAQAAVVEGVQARDVAGDEARVARQGDVAIRVAADDVDSGGDEASSFELVRRHHDILRQRCLTFEIRRERRIVPMETVTLAGREAVFCATPRRLQATRRFRVLVAEIQLRARGDFLRVVDEEILRVEEISEQIVGLLHFDHDGFFFFLARPVRVGATGARALARGQHLWWRAVRDLLLRGLRLLRFSDL